MLILVKFFASPMSLYEKITNRSFYLSYIKNLLIFKKVFRKPLFHPETIKQSAKSNIHLYLW